MAEGAATGPVGGSPAAGIEVRLGAFQLPHPLREHQVRAVAAAARANDPTRAHLVLPPGSGKTLIGAELARRAGRQVLILVPNTAIQAQWVALLRAGRGGPVTVAEDRVLQADFTVLTYHSLATFDAEAPEDANGAGSALHPDAAALLARIADGRGITLVLDEAHHLAQAWGELLDGLLARIDSPYVVALTATPRTRLSAEQADLVDRLFGPVLFAASTPALVRDRVLAPFRELAWFTDPTPAEADYLRQGSTRWLELTTSVLRPGLASTDFLPWLDTTWVRRDVVATGAGSAKDAGVRILADPVGSWAAVERDNPELARAVLRLHAGAGLLDCPAGARVREEHRQPPDAQDWVALLAAYSRAILVGSTDPRDVQAQAQLRAGLRAVGWTLTRGGARRGQAPADRLLARSAAKADAAVTILTQELAVRGPAMAALVITDFATATATPPADLEQVLGPQAGSAWEALIQVARALPGTNPLLVTGSHIAGPRASVAALRDHLEQSGVTGLHLADTPADDPSLASLVGPGWGPRRWVPVATDWLETGRSQVLVGTRGLLGEGWDAARLNVLVDLTAATTPTAVVQVRGRAIRPDPRGDKAANIWSVVALAPSHPLGDADYRRFLAKHEGFHAPDPAGRITLGVAHVSPQLSPFAAPTGQVREELNAQMLVAAADLAGLAQLWGVGQPYEDVDAPVLAVTARDPRSPHLGVAEAAVSKWRHPGAALPIIAASVGAAAPVLAGAPGMAAAVGLVGGAAIGLGTDAGVRALRRSRAARADPDGLLVAIARAVATGLVRAVPEAVAVHPDGQGVWRIGLATTDPAAARLFADALEQAVSPIGWPRYLISRALPGQRAQVWHAVPDAAGVNRALATDYQRAWERHVGRASLVYTGSAQGAGLLAATRGADPLAVTAAVRTQWQ